MVLSLATFASILRCFQLSNTFPILPRIHQATITTTNAAAASPHHMKSSHRGLSMLLAIPPGYPTSVWPPSGIALAAMLALGTRVWPGVWIGAALVNLSVESSWLASALIGTGNTLEALVGATLTRRFIGVPYRFERAEDVLKFIALSALSATVAATIGVMPLVFGHALP